MSLDDDALVCAFDIDGSGKASTRGPSDLTARHSAEGWRWIHLDRTAPASRDWVEAASGFPEVVRDALFEDETRPRVTVIDDGVLVILRGVNLNPGAEPEDMVSIRLFVEERAIVSLRRYKVYAIQALRDAAEADRAPADPAEFLARLADGLTDRLAGTIYAMEDRMDALEDESLTDAPKELGAKVTDLRREIVSYRRFLAPQRDALGKLAAVPLAWMRAEVRVEIRETLETLNRVIEVLDSIRERAAILQESLAAHAAERMNRTMYVLSIVAAIFLPLGFVTGLLGINVGGIPGTQSPIAFAVVCGLIVLIVLVQLWIFRRMRWM